MNGISVFLANAAFFYPIYCFSMFVVRAAPALLHAAFLGHRLLSFDFGPLWIEAACRAPGALARQRALPDTTLLEALLVLGVVAVALIEQHRHRALAGLLVASIGQIALDRPLASLLFGRHYSPALIIAACLYSVVALTGLALMASSIDGGYWKRLAAPVASFCVPLAIFSSFFMYLGADWRVVPVFTAPAVVLAFAAASWKRSRVYPAVAAGFPLRRFATGFAATLVLVSTLGAGEAAHDRAQRAARQALVATLAKPQAPYPKIFFQRGVNFTAEGPVGYNPQSAAPLLDQLKTYGVDSIALVPYGFAESKQPAIHFPGGMERTEDLEAITALAHQRGMKVMLKPQLWTRAGFPGNIDFPDPRQRTQWFAAYRKYLEYYAAVAAHCHADIFSVGVELGKMTPYEPEWRALIARARELYPGPLVYSATQGPDFETIRFWDALDYIGLNEYYPLPDDLSTTDLVRTVETVQKKFARPVLFTEAGFSSYAHPNRAPWDETPRALAPADQARCYEAVLKAFYSKPWFQGVYWWRVGTDASGGPEDGSHTPWGKSAMDVIKHWYQRGGR